MKQGNLFYRWLFYGVAAALFLLLQGLVLTRLRVWGVHPFVPPVLVAVAASWEDRQESLCAAAVFGLVCDLLIPSVIPCFYVLSFVLSAFLVGLIATRLMAAGLLCSVVASMLCLLVNSLLSALFLTYRGGVPFSAVVSVAGRELLLTLPLLGLVYLLFRPIHRRFLAE